MRIRSLYISHFRCYEEAFFEFSPHFNVLHGTNAQGKTSVLEALYYFMLGRSFRSQSQELIKQGQNAFFLEMIFVKHEVEQKLRISLNGQERKIVHHATLLPTLSALFGLIQGTVMTPDDIQLIKGAPALRRQFLDMHIAQIDPLYVHHLTRYHRAMRHRNQLLKARQTSTLSQWENEMGQSAAYLIQQRYSAIQDLQLLCRQFYAELTEEEHPFHLTYTVPFAHLSLEELRQTFWQHLQKNRSRELILGYTLYGPHKDDFFLKLGSQDVRFFASEGQQRSCVTALRLAEWERLKRLADEPPIFMVDDLGMGLDDNRRQRCMHRLTQLGQVFVTTTDPRAVEALPSTPLHSFCIHQGQVIPSHQESWNLN